MKRYYVCCVAISVFLLNSDALSQRKPPPPQDYPVLKRDMFKGTPARPLLTSKRARLYRTVLRQGASQGPNFAGRFTIVTWGAGLGAFSMAVVDASSGKVFFPPFKTVEDTGYGLPFVDKGNNPSWRTDSKLFAFAGSPDAKDGGNGMYVYLFDRGRFRQLYFEKENEEQTKANQQAWEKEIDRRLASMSEISQSFRKNVTEHYPNARCFQGFRNVRYPWPELEVSCVENGLIVTSTLNYLGTPDETADMLKSELQFPGVPEWRTLEGVGDQAIDADRCSRALIRFRKGSIYVSMNANLNDLEKEDPKCSNTPNADSEKLIEFSRRIALVLSDLLNKR